MKPGHLFKFFRVNDNSLDCLSRQGLYLSSPSTFNDPLDCFIEIDDRVSLKEYKALVEVHGKRLGASRKKIESAKRQLYLRASDDGYVRIGEDRVMGATLRDFRSLMYERAGVVSLSSSRDHPLLWCHYADGLKGFCLEFAVHENNIFSNAEKVTYVENRNILPILDFVENKIPGEKVAQETMLTKHSFWSYESEWRLIGRQCDEFVSYEIDDVLSITFGSRCTLEERKKVIAALAPNDNLVTFESGIRSDGSLEFRRLQKI